MDATTPPCDSGLPAAAAPVPTTPAARVRAWRPRLKWGAAACLALLPLVVTAALTFGQTDALRPLFLHDIPERDAGAVAEMLTYRGVPHTVSPNGSIMVPTEMADRLRLEMAKLGYPKKALTGHERLDNARLDPSRLDEPTSFKNALEDELARTIESLDLVEAASVLLCLPRSECAHGAQLEAKASVTLQLRPGQALDHSQLAGIVHLVRMAVPGLPARNVSVTDRNGTLLVPDPEFSARKAKAQP